MKGDLIFNIFLGISYLPYGFCILRDFIFCSISFGVLHLRSTLWVRFIKSLIHKMSVIINTTIIIFEIICNLCFHIFCDINKILTKSFSYFLISNFSKFNV